MPTTTLAPVANDSTTTEQSGLATLYISLHTIAKIVVPGLENGYQFPIDIPTSGIKIQLSVGESANPDLRLPKCEFQICRLTAGTTSKTLYALDKLGVEIATEPQEFEVTDHILPHPQGHVGQEGKFKEGTQLGYGMELGVDGKKFVAAKASANKQRNTEAEASYRRWAIDALSELRGSEDKPWYNVTYDQNCNLSPDKRNLASGLRLELSKPGPDDEHPPHLIISYTSEAPPELQLQIRAVWTARLNIVPSNEPCLLLNNFEYRVSVKIDLSKIGPGESHAKILRIVDRQEFAKERGSIINQSKPLIRKMVVPSSPSSSTTLPPSRVSSSPGPTSLHTISTSPHASSPSLAPRATSLPAAASPPASSLSPLPAPTPLPLVSPSSSSLSSLPANVTPLLSATSPPSTVSSPPNADICQIVVERGLEGVVRKRSNRLAFLKGKQGDIQVPFQSTQG